TRGKAYISLYQPQRGLNYSVVQRGRAPLYPGLRPGLSNFNAFRRSLLALNLKALPFGIAPKRYHGPNLLMTWAFFGGGGG
ncbi:MAG: hypothetical protein LBK45_05095, partial [Tannerellaceae bacterium]|nr:hypothetical protein [Tannerellaceae bacterium]